MATNALFASSGLALLVSTGTVLFVGQGGGGGGSTFTGPYPDAITGLTAWWDAGLLTGFQQSLSAWSQPTAAILDKTTGGNNIPTPETSSSNYTGSIAVPHLNGVLGGAGGWLTDGDSKGTWSPWVANGISFTPTTGFQTGSGTDWTLYFVYSRPNFRQAFVNVNIDSGGSLVPLLTVGGTVVVAMTATGTNDQLILFPGGSQTVVNSSLTRRHTHSITLINTASTGIDVYLDDTLVHSAVANTLGTSNTSAVTFLGTNTAGNGAQCYFHEAARYNKVVAGADLSTLLLGTTIVAPNSAGSCSKRWVRGNRPHAIVLGVGQSNASDWYLISNGRYLAQQAIRYYLQSLSCQFFVGNSTISSGTPVYQDAPGSALVAGVLNPNPTTDPMAAPGWAPGNLGTSIIQGLGGTFFTNADPVITAADLPDVCGVFFYWSENDSVTHSYATLNTTAHAIERLIVLTRAAAGKTAAALGAGHINAFSYTGSANQVPSAGDTQIQAFRTAVANLADPTQYPGLNFQIVLPMTADAMGIGAIYDPSTGTWTGGDNSHMDSTTNNRLGIRMALPIARMLLGSGFGDPAAVTLPNTLMKGLGPSVSHVFLQDAHNVVVTVVHDGGNDLIVALQAVNGWGWTMMDGGTVGSPGPLLQADSCTRLSATKIQVHFPTTITNPAASCLLFYPWGYAKIGPGDCVTDNASLITPPTGFNVGADLGAQWNVNYPIQASSYGFAVSATP